MWSWCLPSCFLLYFPCQVTTYPWPDLFLCSPSPPLRLWRQTTTSSAWTRQRQWGTRQRRRRSPSLSQWTRGVRRSWSIASWPMECPFLRFCTLATCLLECCVIFTFCNIHDTFSTDSVFYLFIKKLRIFSYSMHFYFVFFNLSYNLSVSCHQPSVYQTSILQAWNVFFHYRWLINYQVTCVISLFVDLSSLLFACKIYLQSILHVYTSVGITYFFLSFKHHLNVFLHIPSNNCFSFP